MLHLNAQVNEQNLAFAFEVANFLIDSICVIFHSSTSCVPKRILEARKMELQKVAAVAW